MRTAISKAGVLIAAAAVAAAALPRLGGVQQGGRDLSLSPSAEVAALVAAPCEYQHYSIELYTAYGDPGFPDNACGALSHGETRLETFVHAGPHGRYRISFLKGQGDPIDRFIIYLVGGPRLPPTILPLRSFESEPMVALAALPRTAVLAPEYVGTLRRSFYPGADIPRAADEVVALISSVRSAHPRARILLVGSSAGTLVALEMLRRVATPTILVTPPLDSLHSLLTDRRGTDWLDDLATRQSRFFRYQPSSGDLEEVSVPVYDQIAAFAGDDFRRDTIELLGRIPENRLSCVAIINGRRDRRVRIERMTAVTARFPEIPVETLDMGHGPVNGEEATALAATVDRLSPRVCL